MTEQNTNADLFEEVGVSILDYNDYSAHQRFREEIWHEEFAYAKSPLQYAAQDKYSYTQPKVLETRLGKFGSALRKRVERQSDNPIFQGWSILG